MSTAQTPTALHRHPHPYRELRRRWRHYASQREFRLSLFLSIITVIAAYGIMLLAIQFATERASNSVTDLILSNTPVIDVNNLFVYGTFFLVGTVAFLCATHPKRIPFTLNALALFWLIRSIFVSLTHIAPFETHTAIDFGTAITKTFFGSDLFFSGHTGAPFLFALMYWKERNLRHLFLVWSIFFAVVVLLGHLHYSIDVLAAFFITYAIFHMAQWFFARDFAIFNSDLPPIL
jgi:hypothetical protein